ncbi:CocE/NonD family hydrolase [Peterkaempfera sp. SMS 1(5)a]|uniref:CocE/NonD family hydrolase n=1 Tax=Peterkaempfera podocarpi TaxID=3232308 RepID=UPI00366E5C3A
MHHPHRDIDLRVDLEATMRDGTVLRADVYRPAGSGPWPVLLARTPYGKQDPGVLARLDPVAAARRGYLVVVQDCRGRFRSDGHWQPLVHEGADGFDTVAWAARLPGADGRVGMYGPSYLGHTQRAAMAAHPPQLHAAVPELTWADPHNGLLSRGGALELGLLTHWTLTLGFNVLERRHADRPAELRRHLPLLNSALDNLATHTYWELPAHDLPTVRRLGLPAPAVPRPHSAAHVTAPPAAKARRPERAVPTLTVAGWFDCFLQGSLDNHLDARRSGAPAALIVGPWTHSDQGRLIGDTDFGPGADAAAIDGGASLLVRQLDWLDRHLPRGAPPAPAPVPSAAEPPVLLFVMGVNRWHRLESWPPRSTGLSWYLHTDGTLSRGLPAPDAPPGVFRHDPNDPVPTRGGALLMAPEYPAGPVDQHDVEQRADVLVYTSEPLDAPLEVIGRVRVHLAADSTAPTTDWIARLCDVTPDGVSCNVTDGILRTSPAFPAANGPPPPPEHRIDLWSTAHVFLPGHRIRLQVASSCFPRWDRNPGCHDSAPDDGVLPAARQTVHHDAARPSRLVLPVTQLRAPALPVHAPRTDPTVGGSAHAD